MFARMKQRLFAIVESNHHCRLLVTTTSPTRVWTAEAGGSYVPWSRKRHCSRNLGTMITSEPQFLGISIVPAVCMHGSRASLCKSVATSQRRYFCEKSDQTSKNETTSTTSSSRGTTHHTHTSREVMSNIASDPEATSNVSSNFKTADSTEAGRLRQVDQMLRDVQVEPTPGPEEVPHVGRTAEMSIEECVEVLREEKACNLVVIGLEGEEKNHYTSYFVTCSGLSTRHLRSMSTRLVKEMKGVQVSSVRRVFVEGEDCDDWMVVDMGNIVVHFFLEERRRELELEKLWLLGSNYDDQLRAARKTDNLY